MHAFRWHYSQIWLISYCIETNFLQLTVVAVNIMIDNLCKQLRPRLDCSWGTVWSGFVLFANVLCRPPKWTMDVTRFEDGRVHCRIGGDVWIFKRLPLMQLLQDLLLNANCLIKLSSITSKQLGPGIAQPLCNNGFQTQISSTSWVRLVPRWWGHQTFKSLYSD